MSEHADSYAKPQATRNHIAVLFDRMLNIYGATWSRRIGENVRETMREWDSALHGFSESSVLGAIDIVRNNFKYAPTIAEFRSVCESLKLPTSDRDGKGLTLGGECFAATCKQEAECAFISKKDGQRYWVCWNCGHPANCDCTDIVCEKQRSMYAAHN